MKNIPEFNHFGFIGFGLIGGTIARSLRELYPESEIMAYNYYENRPHPQLELAKEDGVLTYISTELEDFSKCAFKVVIFAYKNFRNDFNCIVHIICF